MASNKFAPFNFEHQLKVYDHFCRPWTCDSLEVDRSWEVIRAVLGDLGSM